MLMGAFRSCVVTYIIDLLTRAYLRLATALACLCSTCEKASLSSVFFVSQRFIYLHASRLIVQPGASKQTDHWQLFHIK